ncbi:hypothetical protein ABT160_18195 [Streptomyces sp. NPDC001941]|uniref:hypothetical protein n=1 Tax=Streptomyces sp. NPDC001941 TaxID=3154659 RepID=UPI00331BDABA
MQPSALPDLAHTHPGPVHWLATAAAMAAVVAGAALLQPDAATASTTAKAAGGARAAVLPAPDPAGVRLPLECGGAPAVVTKRVSGDLDGDGVPETVAAARCDAGSGTPPSGLYVLTRGRDGHARVVATLLEPKEGLSVGELTLRAGVVDATLFGYSSASVPRSSPDREDAVSWTWRGGAFVRAARTADRTV